MKLKTLKDMRIVLNKDCPHIKEMLEWFNIIDGGDKEPIFYIDTDLKQEAIKWIKELESNRKIVLEKEGAYVKPYEDATRYFCKEWIKHFFNITEEDLK